MKSVHIVIYPPNSRYNGDKVQFIRTLRMFFDLSLRDAKDIADNLIHKREHFTIRIQTNYTSFQIKKTLDSFGFPSSTDFLSEKLFIMD